MSTDMPRIYGVIRKRYEGWQCIIHNWTFRESAWYETHDAAVLATVSRVAELRQRKNPRYYP